MQNNIVQAVLMVWYGCLKACEKITLEIKCDTNKCRECADKHKAMHTRDMDRRDTKENLYNKEHVHEERMP